MNVFLFPSAPMPSFTSAAPAARASALAAVNSIRFAKPSSVHHLFACAFGYSAQSEDTRTPERRTPPRKRHQSGAAALRSRLAQGETECNDVVYPPVASLLSLATGWHPPPSLSSNCILQCRIYSAPNQPPKLERCSQRIRGNLS